MLHAQVYTTSSTSYRSFSTGGWEAQPVTSAFRSTSAYRTPSTSAPITYSTAPMRMATGPISTVASQLQGGQLADEGTASPSIKGRHNTMAPPTQTDPFTPIGDGWDVVLLLALLCIAYGIYLRRNTKRQVVK